MKESSSSNSNQSSSTLEEDYLFKQLNAPITSEFLSNILFYISGFIISKLVHKLSCASCKNCLLSHFTPAAPDHDYCSMKYSEVASASAFTLYVNNGGLRIDRLFDRLFDMLNSRNPMAKGFKQPLCPKSKETWEEIFTTTTNYLLSLKTNDENRTTVNTWM